MIQQTKAKKMKHHQAPTQDRILRTRQTSLWSKNVLVATPTYAGISIDSKPCWENLFFRVLPMPGGSNFRV